MIAANLIPTLQINQTEIQQENTGFEKRNEREGFSRSYVCINVLYAETQNKFSQLSLFLFNTVLNVLAIAISKNILWAAR